MLMRASNNVSDSPGQSQSRPQRRHGAAVLRAFTAARLFLGIPIQPKSQAAAARLVASTPQYIRAAIALLEAGDSELIERVLRGNLGLLEAAGLVHKRAHLIKAYREADRHDREALGKVIGVDRLFDDSIAPWL